MPLNTELPHPAHLQLDTYGTTQLVDALALAVDAAAARLHQGGRLVYVGAGTSGRLGLLDSVELHPTFSWPHERAVALLAGGEGALYRAVEGAEDSREGGAADIASASVGALDVVLVLAASGATPYAVAAAEAARAAGALTVGFANNAGAPLLAACEIAVLLDTGPEVISGSTRLKAGTAQKIALNTFSSAVMVKLHKVYGNLMVDVRASNAKLLQRALRLTMLASGAEEAPARAALAASGQRVKLAIVMLKAGIDAPTAEARLQAAQGSIATALTS